MPNQEQQAARSDFDTQEDAKILRTLSTDVATLKARMETVATAEDIAKVRKEITDVELSFWQNFWRLFLPMGTAIIAALIIVAGNAIFD